MEVRARQMMVFGNCQTGVSKLFWLLNLLLNQFLAFLRLSFFWLITRVVREGLQGEERRAGDSSIEEEEEKETMPHQLTQGCWLPHLAPLPTTISVA